MRNESLNKVFKRMMGIDEINPELITQKFDNMKEYMQKFLAAIENINESGILGESLDTYIINSRAELDSLYISSNDLKYIADMKEINNIENPEQRKHKIAQILLDSKYNPEELRVVYNNLINSNLFKHIIAFVNKYITYLKIMKAGNKEDKRILLEANFLLKQSRVQFFDFIDIDFRRYFLEDIDAQIKDYVLKWLSILYKYAKGILDEHCKPNIYPSEYIEVILESIKIARKSVPRCNEAFNMMERLVVKFEEKFNVYYKRFVISGNPYIILEYYIKDVASEVSESDTKIKYQFQTIMSHFSKKINEMPKTDKDIKEVIDLTNAINLDDESDEE